MRTLLSQFCEEFDEILRPLLDPLYRSAQSLASASSDLPGRAVQAELVDLRHHMEALADKVAEQQAYVLIFGPLKSGKSTLMNGICASYVSEVSSLPAYPCMVHVSHADERQYDVVHYNGVTETFADPTALHLFINGAHGELAERIRRADESGEEFDPALQFLQAIRRIDVRMPAGELAQSGAVLVDTPGLYTRMKFGYDRMTREFRNAAACAIFVVKSDNLFLEQVFQEFNELLQLFSRIFLVVNLDTSKRDLGPTGDLVPSLEQKDPLRLIEAFENLVMSAPLKTAAEEGRLRIYPVDLLKAASERLGGDAGVEFGEGTSPVGQANFDAFLKDLTDYLNSTDYLLAFLGDSLRRATSLLAEATALRENEDVQALTSALDTLEKAHRADLGRREATTRLENFDWRSAFGELSEKLSPAIRDHGREVAERTELERDQVLDEWFESDASLQHLVEVELTPLLTRYQRDFSEFAETALEDRVRLGTAGIAIPASCASDLTAAKIDLGLLGREALEMIDRRALSVRVGAPLRSEQIPVRKSFWDWLFFRSRSKVRRRLFGTAERASLRIPVEVKQARLGKAGKEAMRSALDEFMGGFFDETVERVQVHTVSNYASAGIERVEKAVSERASELDGLLADQDRRLKELRKILNHLTSVQTEAQRATQAIEELSTRYGHTDPDLLIQPVSNGDRQLPTPPAAGEVGGASSTPAPKGVEAPERA